MEEKKIDLLPPWEVYAQKIKAMFDGDPDIKIEVVDQPHIVKIKVNNQTKADALSQLLPEKILYGSVTVAIKVTPVNNGDHFLDLINRALDGNPNFAYTKVTTGVFPGRYVVMKKKVAQYPSDNLYDPHGVTSTLYADLAMDLFGGPNGVFYCTDTADPDPNG